MIDNMATLERLRVCLLILIEHFELGCISEFIQRSQYLEALGVLIGQTLKVIHNSASTLPRSRRTPEHPMAVMDA
jgi:hypothetical protein